MKIECVCDTCLYGIHKDKMCYKGGIDKCLKNAIYTLYKNELTDQVDKLSILNEQLGLACHGCHLRITNMELKAEINKLINQ